MVDFIEKFNVPSSRFAVVYFSDNGNVLFNLGANDRKDDLIREVRSVPFIGGKSNLADGLRLARTDVFNRNGDSPERTNIAIVISDGKENVDSTNVFSNADSLQGVAKVFAVGVTNKISYHTLERIASDYRDVWRVNTYTQLSATVDAIYRINCCSEDEPDPIRKSITLTAEATWMLLISILCYPLLGGRTLPIHSHVCYICNDRMSPNRTSPRELIKCLKPLLELLLM